MLRFFLFLAGVMAVSTSTAGDVSPCSADSVPIQAMTPGYGSEIILSPAEISESLPHFRAFVADVTEHVAARLAAENLCIKVAGGMKGLESVDSMRRAASDKRSLLQFVRWPLSMHREFLVPVLPSIGGVPIDCRISSPWLDLEVIRKPVPQIRGIVRWNERQFLADQAALDGAKNAPQSKPMPLTGGEYGHFIGEYDRSEVSRKPEAKPIEERVPPDLLWLFRRTAGGQSFGLHLESHMRIATWKGAAGYTKLVNALIDRCFAPDETRRPFRYYYYNNILDAADLIPLDQYKIDMPLY